MKTIEFIDSLGKFNFLYGEVTRKDEKGFYILSFGEEYYIANTCVMGIWE